jgi:hypothetical protein
MFGGFSFWINITMKCAEILNEYNEQRLLNDFANKLVAKSKTDTTAPKNKTSQEIIQQISNLDQTPNKEFTFWLVMNYANSDNPKFNGGIQRYEDIASRAIPEIEKFKALLRKPNLTPPLQVRDINQVRGLSSLESIVDTYQPKQVVSNKEQANTEEQTFYSKNQAKLLYNDNQIKVLIPKTEQASCFFGKGTKWCTAATTKNNMFSQYNKPNDPLYIIITKGTNEKYQFHFGSGQFMNAQDTQINPQELANKYPILYQIFEPIAIKNLYLPLIKNPSEEIQLAAVKQNVYVWAIQFIKNPSEEVQLAAVKQNGYAIQYIQNPSEKSQLTAVNDYGNAIQFIKNPSEEVQLAAVKQDGYAIQYIKNPSEEVQLAAVKQDGYAIKFIKNPSEKMQLAAVKRNGGALSHLKNPSEKVKIAALQRS